MAADKLTKYFTFCIGPLLLYIIVTLYLKDEESLAKTRDGLIESEQKSRGGPKMFDKNQAKILNRPEHPSSSYGDDENLELVKQEILSTQNKKKSEQFNDLPKSNNFAEDFSFDDPKFYKSHEIEKDFIQKEADEPVQNKVKDLKINTNNEAPLTDTGKKKISKSSIGVSKEPDAKWCRKKRIRVLILVFTRPEHSYERIVVRNTWIKYTARDFAILFVMGKPEDGIMAGVNEEFENFQDILMGNFKDQKRSETTKFMMTLMWFSQLQDVCKVPRYVLKTDDNIYINMDALDHWIEHKLPRTKNLYLGRVVRKDEPVRNRNNPRYVPKSVFQDFVFPDYLNGPQYLFSDDVMHRMAYVTRLVFPIAVEDAYIGLLCHRLEIRPIGDENFDLLMKTTNVCVNAKLLFIFCKSAKEMSKLHKEINKKCSFSGSWIFSTLKTDFVSNSALVGRSLSYEKTHFEGVRAINIAVVGESQQNPFHKVWERMIGEFIRLGRGIL